MTAIALARTAVLLAAAFAAGCASDPGLPRVVTVAAGQPTRVLLQQVRQQQTFLLQNASSTEAAQFYGGATATLAKVVPDAQLQVLLDILAQKGMFGEPRAAVPPEARDVLVVEQGDRRWIWARRRAGIQAEEASFHEARAYFLELFNSNMAFHASAPGQRPDLRAEQERVRSDAEAARSRLEGLQGRQP
jgi:hypothetical protein